MSPVGLRLTAILGACATAQETQVHDERTDAGMAQLRAEDGSRVQHIHDFFSQTRANHTRDRGRELCDAACKADARCYAARYPDLATAHTTAYFAPGTIVSPPSPSPGPLWEMPKNMSSPNSCNEGYKTDLAEPGAALRGAKTRSARQLLFARSKAHVCTQSFARTTRSHYHDGIFGKRNKFNLLLHETFGGGFSPPAVAKINCLARKAQRSGVDRTAYPPHSRLSFVSHHAERISIASVKGVNRAILDRRAKLASELSRRA